MQRRRHLAEGAHDQAGRLAVGCEARPETASRAPGGVVRVELAHLADVLAMHALCAHAGRCDDAAQPHRAAARLVEGRGLKVGQALDGAVAEEHTRDEALPAPRVRVAPELT